MSIDDAGEKLETELNRIILEEVLKLIQNLKNGKASAPNQVSAEILKASRGISKLLRNFEKTARRLKNCRNGNKLQEQG